MPKFTFHTNFHVAFTPNHWSNLEKCEGLFKVIIFPYLSAKKKELGYQKDQRSLIIMDTFIAQENEEMKQLCAKNNCELVIVPRNLTNRIQPLNITINLSTKKLICNKCNPGMLIELANNCETELQLAMLNYPSNWVIWNLFILIVETYNHLKNQNDSIIKCLYAAEISEAIICANKQCLHTSRKPFRWTKTTKEFLVVFSLFSWKQNLI